MGQKTKNVLKFNEKVVVVEFPLLHCVIVPPISREGPIVLSFPGRQSQHLVWEWGGGFALCVDNSADVKLWISSLVLLQIHTWYKSQQ